MSPQAEQNLEESAERERERGEFFFFFSNILLLSGDLI